MLLLLLLLKKDLRNLPYIIFIQDQHLPLSLFIHWTNMRGKCPTHNQCDDIFSATSSTLHHQIHEGAHPNFHSCPTAPAATQRLSSPTTFWKVVPSESPPTTKPRSSQDFFWAWKNLRFLFQHRGEPWKIYHLSISFISWDESVLHLKNSSLIQATRQGFLQVEFTQRWSTPFLRYKGICLGFQTFDWDIGKLHKKKSHHRGKIQSIFQEDSFPITLLKVRSFQIPMSQSQLIEGCRYRKVAVARNWTTYCPCF